MAYRDVLAVLSGLRRVAIAYCAEVSSEVQHTITSSGLRQLGSALCERVADQDGGRDGGLDWDSFGEDSFTFTGLTTEALPPTPSPGLADTSLPSPVMPTEERVHTSSDCAPQSVDIRSNHSDTATPPFQRRTYHTQSFLLRAHSRHFHTTSLYSNATIIESNAPSSVKCSARNSDKAPQSHKQKLTSRARERAVPSSRISRMVNFGGLAASLGIGTATEVAKRALGISDNQSSLGKNPLLTEANIERIVNTLCKVRGAALKLGQMISLQDGAIVSEPVQQVFERVRNNADFMPTWQMERVLREELGTEWRQKLKEFDPRPLAAASIGQVHRATMHDGREVAMKIQYPGVAQSINSDIDNLLAIIKLWNIVPDGLFLDNTIDVARKELAWETDYTREARYGMEFKKLLSDDPRFEVPAVISELSTRRVLTSDLVHGMPLDQCARLPQEAKNDIAERILSLCLRELFEFRLMQTDPNWSNFFYNEADNKLYLLDFGATRSYCKSFTDDYIKVIKGAANSDRVAVTKGLKDLGFLSGYESQALVEAHVDAVMILGEPFMEDKPFDFGRQETTQRIRQLVPVMMEDRLIPPPEESYSLHRKWAGAFLLCTRLGAVINCLPMFQHVYQKYNNTS